MADIAIIIGNGFDIDMGLPSRYSDFIKSKEWEAVVKRVDMFLQDEDYLKHSLIGQLLHASQHSNWFDIEEEIHKFVASHTQNTAQEINEIQSEFTLIKEGLMAYLSRVSMNFKADENKIGYKLLDLLQNTRKTIIEIIFNYTYPHLFLKKGTYYVGCLNTSVHGSLREGDIVLGCDLQEGEQVNRQLSFMYKYNMLKKTNYVARSLLGARDIIFFGHSVNEMDFRYFKAFFKEAAQAPEPRRHLTFITYDEESERNIKDNIQSQGISVTDLYSNLWTFDFIHSSKYYEGDIKEKQKWNEMMQRLLCLNENGL